MLQCIEKGLSLARAKHAELKVMVLGITNQRETTMAWDSKTGVLFCGSLLRLPDVHAFHDPRIKVQMATVLHLAELY